MPAYAAFLRAINVGGHQVKGKELRAAFDELGLRDVATFRASGNVIFTAGPEPAGRLAARIEDGLAKALGYEVPVFLRTAAELRTIAEHEPFPAPIVEASRGKLQVSLLRERPSAAARRELLALAGDHEGLAFTQRELFWLPSGGVSDSVLDMKTIERTLGPSTMRTKGTLEQIVAKHFARGR